MGRSAGKANGILVQRCKILETEKSEIWEAMTESGQKLDRTDLVEIIIVKRIF